ncbi:MAG: proline--tRNA ligase [Sedimentisphaerales bacterium]|nr:proline--tRNA ligase [Sedimentisphaerales bacterium]
MKYSQMLIPTVKEVPADAEVPSHQLMIRAGLIRKVASGTYTYLPLGWRCLRKIIEIVRQEMDRAGAQEILVPCLQPRELWQQTGRDTDYGETMCRVKDRHGRWNVLGPTAEEVFTYHAAAEINSYKQLPINLYQISPKFRDEFRPRFGVLRSREFIMKDAYSFDADEDSLHKSYMAMYNAYCRVFERCGLEYVIVQAESGEMGGSGSHQFTIPCASGEDTIVHTEDGSYAANLEKAAVDPLPKQQAPDEVGAPEDVHTPNVGTIEAVCAFLKTEPREMIKTLIFDADGETVAALIRGDHEMNPEKLTQTLGGKHSELADEATIEKVTGARVGFAGPMGLGERVSKLLVDHAVAAMAVGVTGANKTDYHTRNVVPGRDFPLEGDNVLVADLRNAVEGDTYDGKPLLFRRGIEVGQVFKLGTKYSKKLGATFLDEHGAEKPCLMGCYGIGINRIMASAIELYHDKNGTVWPISIAPFEVLITAVNQDDPDVARVSQEIYERLGAAGIEVLLDDRDLRGGVKFKDADLIGIPVRVTVGKRSVAEGNVEIKLRTETESTKSPIAEAPQKVIELVGSLKEKLNG